MPFALEQLTQGLSVADFVPPQTVNNANLNSLGIDMSKFQRAIFYVIGGSLGSAGTLDGRLQSAAASNFATPHNIASSNLTQITANNVAATLEIRADQLQSGDRYVRLQLTGGGNALTVGILGLGAEAEYKPASNNNLNSTYLTQQIVM
jgi:hypothetical protein